MNKEQLDRVEKNQQEIIGRLKILEKGLNKILPTPVRYRDPNKKKPKNDAMNLNEAAKFLGVGRTTLNTMALDGKIPFETLPKGRVYYRSELQDWIKHRPQHHDARRN